MTVINGMEVREEIVDFLKLQYRYAANETSFDSYAEQMSAMNDYLIDILTNVCLDDTDKMKAITNHLVNIKSIKDMMKELSRLLKSCKIEGNDESN